MKKLSQILMTVMLLPQLVYAADANLWSSKVDVTKDLSLYLLRQIFGQVGGGIESGVGTVLGQIFGVFNAGLVAITGLFLCFTITKAITATATEGEAMGRQMNHFVPIRVALGIGLLIPKATGYSVLNVIVMWIVTQGVIFANMAWQASLNYLNSGGVLYVQPKTITQDSPEVIDTKLLHNGSEISVGSDADASTIMRSLVCMHYQEYLAKQTSQDVTQDMQNTNYANYPKPESNNHNYQKLHTALQVPNFTPEWDTTKALVYFPGNLTGTPYEKWQGICGVYGWGWETDVSANKEIYFEAKRLGLQQLVDDLTAITKYMVNAITSLPVTADYDSWIQKYKNMGAGLLLDAAVNYQSIIYPARVEFTNGYIKRSEKGAMDFYKDAIANGWITAGRYYYSIMMLANVDENMPDKSYYKYQLIENIPPGVINSLDTANIQLKNFDQRGTLVYKNTYMPSADNVLGFWQQNCHTNTNLLNILLQWVNTCADDALILAAQVKQNLVTGSSVAASLTSLPADMFPVANGIKNTSICIKLPWKTPGTEEHATACLPMIKGFKGATWTMANQVVFKPLAKNLGSIYGVWRELLVENRGNYPAIVKLQKLGSETLAGTIQFWQDVMDIIGTIVVLYFGTSTVLTAGIGVAAATPWYGTALQNVLNAALHIGEMAFKLFVEIPVMVSLPLALAIVTPMFVVGILLAFYVPMVPFMLFTFGTISWLIFVIEAMAAAPLVALGITHPEGQNLLGKAEQSLMLLLSVFVRPITMIIGLITAIILSNISLEILNMGYGYAVASIFFNSSLTDFTVGDEHANNIYQLMRGGFVVLLYPFIALPIVNQCFSLIYLIPEKIMRWLGMHPDASMEAQMLEGVKGMVQQQGESIGRGAGDAATRAAGGLQGFGVRMPIPPGNSDSTGGLNATGSGGGEGAGEGAGAASGAAAEAPVIL